jgi:hypothetical protein
MASGGRMVVFTNFAAGREQEYNRWYDDVHVPEVLEVGPIVGCQRFKVVDSQMMPQTHSYLAIYEFEGGAKEALDALQAANGSMAMTDAMQDPHLCMVEPLGPRVTKAESKSRSKKK